MIALGLMAYFGQVQGQENIKGLEFVDVIYLKNGSVFRGNIAAYQPGEQVTIEIAGATPLIFKEGEILKIRQERLDAVKKQELQKPTVVQEEKPKDKNYEFKERGWYNATYFALGSGQSNGNVQFVVGLHNITGFMLKRQLGIGLGIGVDNYAVGTGEVVYPIFAEARGYFTPTYRSFYYSVAVGYGLAFKNDNNFVTRANGGYMFHPAIGVRFGASAESNITLDIGYKQQQAGFTREVPFTGEIDIREVTYRRLIVRAGLLF